MPACRPASGELDVLHSLDLSYNQPANLHTYIHHSDQNPMNLTHNNDHTVHVHVHVAVQERPNLSRQGYRDGRPPVNKLPGCSTAISWDFPTVSCIRVRLMSGGTKWGRDRGAITTVLLGRFIPRQNNSYVGRHFVWCWAEWFKLQQLSPAV